MNKIIQLKIEIQEVSPTIWRRLQVENSITFSHLHKIIQNAFGWHNCHLFMFHANNSSIGIPHDSYDEEVLNSDKVTIEKYMTKKGYKLTYEYDFGDGWIHKITVEDILPKEDGVKYPLCMAGKRNCPPEDCGGPWGYEDLLNAIKNKKHPEHKDMIEWLGGEGAFDPEEFDLESINKILR